MTVGELIDQLIRAADSTTKGREAEVHVAGGHYTAAGQRLRVEPAGDVVRIGSTTREGARAR